MPAVPEPLLRELIGALLRRERRRQGRTLAQVAGTAGISMQHLSDMERGRKDPSSEVLAAVTGALGLGMGTFLGRLHELVAEQAAPGPRVLDLTVARPSTLHRSAATEHRRARTAAATGTVTALAAA